MPREIKTTLAVDGEAAFKRAINEANTSIRNMGTQLTLAQAQFKKDGDAMKLMETRSKALKGEIGQQEEIVKALEKAVEDSTKAYGENSAKTEKWEAELNRAKARLVGLQNELTLNEAGLDRNGRAFDEGSQHAADYQATLQTIGKNVSFETVSKGISGITGKFEDAVKKVWNFAKGLKDAMVDSGKWADDLVTSATTHGFTLEEEQRWQYAAQFVDTEVDTIFNARQKLTSKMDKGWKKDNLNMWQVLGIDLKDAETGQIRDKMDVMWELGETLLHISEMQERGTTNMDAEALSMDVFGKSWRDLLPLFTAGREEFEKAMAEAPVVADESVVALNSSYDAVQRLESQWDALQKKFFAEIAPTMEEVTDALSGMLEQFNEWIDTDEGKQAMSDLSAAIKELFSGLKDVKFSDAIDKAKTAIEGVKKALEWLKDNKGAVEDTLKAVGLGFLGLKLGEGAMDILKLITGIRFLTGKGAASAAARAGEEVGTSFGTTFGAALLKAVPWIAGLVTLLTPSPTSDTVGNNELLNENGELTNEAKEYGYTKNANGEIVAPWENQEPLQFGFKTTPEEYEDVDLDKAYSAAEKLEAIQDWWDAHRNAESGVDSWDEEESSRRYMEEVLGDQFGQFWDTFLEKTEGKDMSNVEDLPKSITDSVLNDAIAEMKVNTESTQKAADKVAEMDMKKFNSLPANVQDAVRRGAASGVSGIRVYIDGQAAGRLLAPYVNSELGSQVG